MILDDFLIIARFINDCPNCKNDKVGNGEGTIVVEETMVERTCKCGFIFHYDVSGGITIRTIQEAIYTALNKMEETKMTKSKQ